MANTQASNRSSSGRDGVDVNYRGEVPRTCSCQQSCEHTNTKESFSSSFLQLSVSELKRCLQQKNNTGIFFSVTDNQGDLWFEGSISLSVSEGSILTLLHLLTKVKAEVFFPHGRNIPLVSRHHTALNS